MFPRKVFTEDELQKSFCDLSLTPTCTLLVIQSPSKTSRIISASPFGGIFYLFTLIFIAPLQTVYSVVAGWLGWNSGNGSTATSRPRQTKDDAVRMQREPRSEGATIRRRGNTSRLHNTNDDTDDENANWNGNSTQFL